MYLRTMKGERFDESIPELLWRHGLDPCMLSMGMRLFGTSLWLIGNLSLFDFSPARIQASLPRLASHIRFATSHRVQLA